MIPEEDLITDEQTQFDDVREQAWTIFNQVKQDSAIDLDQMFDRVVIEALDDLPQITTAGILVEINGIDILFRGEKAAIITAMFNFQRRSITLYSVAILLTNAIQEYVLEDYVRRLLIHEFGHSQGMSDQEMAERFGY